VNLADIRTKVRAVVDMDTVDLSNDLLDMYIKDGYERLIAVQRRWPFFEKTFSLSTVADQGGYTISSIGTGDVLEIASVLDTTLGGNRLTLIAHEDGESVWNAQSDTAGRPLHFSFWEQKIHLWPRPNGVYTLSLRGWRKPIDWMANTTTEVDADSRLHQALVYYAIAQVYQLQEDVELSTFYRRSFDEAIRLVVGDIFRPSSHRPMILSGSRFHETSSGFQYPVYY
jgi:hypothetical protein